jgi:hypothetical protein
MVKVSNIYGDLKFGKQGDAVYQNHYGNQVRRKWDGKKKNNKPKQIEVQEKFRAGLEFANSLTPAEKQSLEYWINSNKLRMTWHNFACSIAMTPVKIEYSVSRFQIVLPFSFSQSIRIEHPAIKRIDLYGKDEGLVLTVTLTNLESGNIINNFSYIPSATVTSVDVTTGDDKVWHGIV